VEKHVDTTMDKHVEGLQVAGGFSSKHATTGSMLNRAGCVHSVV